MSNILKVGVAAAVLALGAGCTDLKPLEAEVNGLKNTVAKQQAEIDANKSAIDAASRQVWADDQPVELTANEFDLLRILAEHRGIALSREQLLEKAWGANYFGEIRVVDVHVGHLRQKLDQAGSCITTVRGVGYRFDDERV